MPQPKRFTDEELRQRKNERARQRYAATSGIQPCKAAKQPPLRCPCPTCVASALLGWVLDADTTAARGAVVEHQEASA